MHWVEGWRQFHEPTRTGNVSELLENAARQINEADNREKILEFIKTYESVLEIDPYNYEALWSLGRWRFSVDTETENKEEKKECFVNAIKYCEQAMYTNPLFKESADKGEKLWDACRVLTRREMAAMQYWYSSMGMYWLECMKQRSL